MALDIEYKPERHPKRWVALIIILLILGASGWFGYKWYTTGDVPFPLPITIADRNVNEKDLTFDQVNSYKVSATAPRYIKIPSLSLGNTRIFPVGLDGHNLPALPDNIHDAGWYTKSANPGSGGVVLIDGYNLGINANGAFAKLGSLQKGDKITIERGDGQLLVYSVVENQSMALDEAATTGSALMAKPVQAGQEGLNLITFDGKWVPKLATFDRRIIVRAALDSTNNS